MSCLFISCEAGIVITLQSFLCSLMGTSPVGARTLAHGAEEESDTGSSIGDVRGLESAQGVEGSLG